MLFSTEDLCAHQHDPDWILFDCRHDLADTAKGQKLYDVGHIPGAYFAGVDTDLSGMKTGRGGRHPLPQVSDFLAFLARSGVTPASTIVAYDDAGGFFAGRLWWMLERWLGHKQVGLLDGGITRWRAENRALSTEVPAVRKTTPLRNNPNSAAEVPADELLAHLGDKSLLVIDARAENRYRGEVEPIDRVAGHIPGAVNRCFKSNLNTDLTFKSREVLRRDYDVLLKSRSPESVVHHCGSGITSCLNLFSMEYAGLTGSRLYVGSWSDWVADPSRPVAVGAE